MVRPERPRMEYCGSYRYLPISGKVVHDQLSVRVTNFMSILVRHASESENARDAPPPPKKKKHASRC